MLTLLTRSLARTEISKCFLKVPKDSIIKRQICTSLFLKNAEVKPADQHFAISRAMKIHMLKAKASDEFLEEKRAEYEIGKRHLANMMGLNPETISQAEINEAIEYLLPSGLFQPYARPMMKPPEEIYPGKIDIRFDYDGRPFHTLFYTGKPSFYELLQKIASLGIKLNAYSQKPETDDSAKQIATAGTRWVKKEEFEKLLRIKIAEIPFSFFISSMTRLVEHDYAYKIEGFINGFRVPVNKKAKTPLPELEYTENGVAFSTGIARRKKAHATVTVYGQGSGDFKVNDRNILYFEYEQDREQIMSPLNFTGLLKTVDVVARCHGGGHSGQAGAIRYALSTALAPFIEDKMIIKMNLAGLLTRDIRIRERRKAGQKGPRAKWIWRKR